MKKSSSPWTKYTAKPRNPEKHRNNWKYIFLKKPQTFSHVFWKLEVHITALLIFYTLNKLSRRLWKETKIKWNRWEGNRHQTTNWVVLGVRRGRKDLVEEEPGLAVYVESYSCKQSQAKRDDGQKVKQYWVQKIWYWWPIDIGKAKISQGRKESGKGQREGNWDYQSSWLGLGDSKARDQGNRTGTRSCRGRGRGLRRLDTRYKDGWM